MRFNFINLLRKREYKREVFLKTIKQMKTKVGIQGDPLSKKDLKN
jgi:hypothetical protein